MSDDTFGLYGPGASSEWVFKQPPKRQPHWQMVGPAKQIGPDYNPYYKGKPTYVPRQQRAPPKGNLRTFDNTIDKKNNSSIWVYVFIFVLIVACIGGGVFTVLVATKKITFFTNEKENDKVNKYKL